MSFTILDGFRHLEIDKNFLQISQTYSNKYQVLSLKFYLIFLIIIY
jgi:hypothetical protein